MSDKYNINPGFYVRLDAHQQVVQERGDCAAEVLRLREAIRDAPHEEDCQVRIKYLKWYRDYMNLETALRKKAHKPFEDDEWCDCWKRRVLDE